MRVKIIPHGVLCETWPSGFECEAATPAEAMRALEAQFDLRKAGATKWHVRLSGYNTAPELNSPLRGNELHVVPDFSGGGGTMKIIIGVVLVVIAVVLVATGYGAALAPYIGTMGLSMILGGILELLTPAPKTAAPQDPGAESRYLGSPKNTTKIGTRATIGYGRHSVYGHYVSFGVASNPSAETANAAARRQAAGLTS